MKNSNQIGNTAIYIMLSVIIALLVLIVFMLVGSQPRVELPVPFDKNGVCEYSGRTYMYGESFTSDDGCNSCSCAENGQVACTDMACNVDLPSQIDGDAPVSTDGAENQ